MKQSHAVVYDKVREVYTYMNNVSKQRKDVVQFFSKKWTDDGYFTCDSDSSKHRHIDIYIRKVRQMYFNFEKDADIEKGRTLSRLDELYEKNIEIQDYKAAKDVLKEISMLCGLYAETKINHSNKGDKFEALPVTMPDDLKKLINGIKAE